VAGLYIQVVTLTIGLRHSAGLKNDRRRLDRAALAVYLVNRNRAEILNEQIRIDPVRPSLPLPCGTVKELRAVVQTVSVRKHDSSSNPGWYIRS
jgi:hypothetical protein